MKKTIKILLFVALTFIVVTSALKVGASEQLNTSCNGGWHIIPIIKDEWKAWTTITVNGLSATPNLSDAQKNSVYNSCYTYTTIEAWGANNSYDNGYKALYGWDAVDPSINSPFAKASVRGVKKVESTHLGRNCYTTYDLKGSRTWTK